MNGASEVTILVLEQDEKQKEYICDRLEKHGYKRLLCASSTEEACELINNEDMVVDIVLLGNSQDLDCIETAKKIKKFDDKIIVILFAESEKETLGLEAVFFGCESVIPRGEGNLAEEITSKVNYWSNFKYESVKLQNLYIDRREYDV